MSVVSKDHPAVPSLDAVANTVTAVNPPPNQVKLLNELGFRVSTSQYFVPPVSTMGVDAALTVTTEGPTGTGTFTPICPISAPGEPPESDAIQAFKKWVQVFGEQVPVIPTFSLASVRVNVPEGGVNGTASAPAPLLMMCVVS